MTKFEVLKGITDIEKFSELIIDTLGEKRTSAEIKEFLSEEITEEGLQTLRSIAQRGYPLSLECKQ